MPTYNIKCIDCKNEQTLSCTIIDFQSINKNKFKNIICKKCGNSNFNRIYNTISSKVSKSSQEIVEKAREEARNIVEKIKNGDQHTIRDIYGEGE